MPRGLILAMLALSVTGTAMAAEGGYQRWRQAPAHSGEHGWGGRAAHPQHHQPQWGGYHHPPQRVTATTFQRPYPYHLDYYRVRYGGSYAPYFGNMYGVPQVVAPVYGYPPLPYGYGYGAPPAAIPPAESP